MSTLPHQPPIDTTRWASHIAPVSLNPQVSIHYLDCPPLPQTPTASTSPPHGTILLIHGWPQTSYQYRHVITPLSAAGFRVLVPDYRGAGLSSKPEDPQGFRKSVMAEDLHRLVTEHLGIREKIHVVGHDIGGMVAHAYATRFADSVASVIWGECPLPGTQVFEDVKSAQALWHFAFHAVVDLPEQLTQGGREGVYLRSFYDKLKVNAKGIRKLDEEEYVAMFERPGAMRCGFELYRRFPEDAEENRKWLKEKDRCKVPVLALSGEKSPIREFAERQVKEVYEEDVVEVGFVQGAGHYVAEENPADFVERVLGFVRKHMSN